MSLLSTISPKWAYKRAVWRQAYQIQRSYDAGMYDRTNRNWLAVNESGEATDRNYRDTVRARSRDLERNSDIMNSAVLPWVRNVIGKGFELEAKSEDTVFNDEIENLWNKWCKKDNCDITGSQSFWEMARMAVRRKRIDGGILFIKCYTDDGVVPFKLQAIEVDELDISAFAPKTQGNRVVGGIEYDSYNKAVGYWIRQYDIEGYTQLTPIYVPRERVIFYFSKTRPSQIREMPEMAASIGRIKELNGFIEAASIKERIAACLAVFIKKELPTNELGMKRPGGPRKSYNDLELTPGLVTDLNEGDDLQVVNPGNSATNGTSFIKSILRLISSGLGVSYEATSRDLSEANYSSARQATIEDEETFIPEQEKLKDEFLDEAYKEFVISAVMSGAVKAPLDFLTNIDKYINHNWNRKPKKWIDPYKEARANQIAIESGQKTIDEIWREDGRDYRTVIDDMKKVQEYAKEKGLKTSLSYLGGGEKDG